MEELDTLVIGAGPAGSAAAIELARSGRSVALVDKATFPRDKCCGDGLTTLALRELERLDFDPATVDSWTWVGEVRVRTPGGRVLDLDLPAGPGRYSAVARRADLDAALVDLARAHGASLRSPASLTGLTIDGDGATAELGDHDTVRARHVVAADGMWSTCRKLLGLDEPGYRGELHALRQYVRTDNPEARRQWVWFEPDLLPGYAWSFPVPGGANIGIAIQRGDRLDGGAVKVAMAGLADRPPIAEVIGPVTGADPVKAWPIPGRLAESCLAHGPVLFVGDAARACDPLTGEGIAQAIATGAMAGREIVAGDDPLVAARRYARSAHRRLDADERMARWCVRALGTPPRADLALGLAGITGWSRRNVARWMFEDEPRGIALTPRRWHAQSFRRPGAYAD
ncbi:MAG: geranylgeranyl reductase family protein [Actinomycetota bacterium]